MNVNPTDASPIQVPIVNERDDIAMRNDSSLMHFLVGGE
jgi:hypothetical protein